jgi:hypothetical protein
MLCRRKITAILTGEKLEGSVAKCCLQRGILLPLLCYVLINSYRDSAMAVIHWGMHYHQQQKTPKYCLKIS